MLPPLSCYEIDVTKVRTTVDAISVNFLDNLNIKKSFFFTNLISRLFLYVLITYLSLILWIIQIFLFAKSILKFFLHRIHF